MSDTITNKQVTSEQLYRDYKEPVRRYIESRTNHTQDAEDLLSSVFVKIHENLHTYDPGKAGLSTWIYTITRNTVSDYLRRQYRMPIFDPGEDVLADCVQEDLPMLDKMILEEQMEALAGALERLPGRERDIILLRFYYERNAREIAAMMKFSHENVRYLQHIAIGKLKKMMGDALR